MIRQAIIILFLYISFVPVGFELTSRLVPGMLPKTISRKMSWPVQSIDTMKYSRDEAAAQLLDPTFDKTIDQQIHAIAQTGATYVAIATPYDPEFVPMLARWVATARKYNLHVWFRGNFSGWEGWFSYAAITRDQHKELLDTFIRNNPDLFKDGDIFTSCPECENGGPGDPRQTGDVTGYRQFLISEYQIATNAFQSIHKKVSVGYTSMNFDVARLVMDPATTKALGGIVTIDHYVSSPEILAMNIRDLARESGGKIFLGEFGVPIPDINGDMTETDQASWIKQALTLLSGEPEVIGINYWVGFGGTTALWNDDGSPRTAVPVITSFFSKRSQ